MALVGEGRGRPGRAEALLEFPMTCHSGGTLEIYVEPYLPKPLLLLVGHGPVLEALATLGRTADYAITTVGEHDVADEIHAIRLTRRASVVVATHGDRDEDALVLVLESDAGYVSLVASRRRAAAVLERLGERGVPAERLARLKAPAGLDIGAVSPQEIAVSILAEIIQHHRSDVEVRSRSAPARGERDTVEAECHASPAATEATDPICGMTVEIATAAHRADVSGRLVYFCCRHCQETFDRDPERHLARLGGAGGLHA